MNAHEVDPPDTVAGDPPPLTPAAGSTQRLSVPRASWRWWTLALAATALGVGLAVPLAHAVLPSTASATTPTSSQIFTSTGGTFTRDHAQQAAPFTLPELSDQRSRLTLAQLHGHPLILNFWASWCAPCRQEMPALQAVARREAGRVSFVGIDTNDQRGSALSFLRTTGVTYPVGFDPSAASAARYGVYGLPTTFFISADGRLLGHQVGALTQRRLIQLIGDVFGPAAEGRAHRLYVPKTPSSPF